MKNDTIPVRKEDLKHLQQSYLQLVKSTYFISQESQHIAEKANVHKSLTGFDTFINEYCKDTQPT